MSAAFPRPVTIKPNSAVADKGASGMSLRAWLVGQILQGSSPGHLDAQRIDELALAAVGLADRVIEHLGE